MALDELEDIVKRVDNLTYEEQLSLIEHLTRKIREAKNGSRPRLKWSDMVGSVPYPLTGEDAQAWVTRTRQEDQAHRDSLIERGE